VTVKGELFAELLAFFQHRSKILAVAGLKDDGELLTAATRWLASDINRQ